MTEPITKPGAGEAVMACEALAAEAQGRAQYRTAAILRLAAHALRAFGPMLEALEVAPHGDYVNKIHPDVEALMDAALALARKETT